MNPEVFALILLSGAIHALWNFFAKKSATNLSVSWVAQLVALSLLLSVAAFRFWSGTSYAPVPAPQSLLWVVLAGLVQAGYFLLLTLAYQTGDVSVVYPIARGIGVAGASVSGIFFYHDAPSFQGMLGCVIVAVGTAYIGISTALKSRSSFRSVWLAGAVGICLAMGSAIDKMGALSFDPPLYLALVYVVSCLLGSSYFLTGPRRTDVVMAIRHRKRPIMIIGLGASIGYLIILFALRLGPLGYTSAVREISIILGSASGILFLGERLTKTKCIGLTAILVGILLIRFS